MKKFSFDDLQGKVAVITGGAGVIGKALVEAMAGVDMKIAIVDLMKEAAENVAQEISSQSSAMVIGVEGNVLQRDSLEKAHAEIKEKLGSIDVLINGAGGNSPKATTARECMTPDDLNDLDATFFGLDIDGFNKVFALNFTGTLLPSMVFGRDMIEKQSGTILNVSSMNSFRPLTKIPAYSAAKASINNFTEWLSVHLARMNIRVNAIAPGFFLTNQNRFLLIDEKSGGLTERGEKIIAGTPMQKFGEPEDLQGTTLFLLSDLSKFITGVVVPVDGGFNAYSGV